MDFYQKWDIIFTIDMSGKGGIAMKFNRADFQIWKNVIYVIPTVKITINDLIYCDKNVSIEIHFLVFHLRILFMQED